MSSASLCNRRTRRISTSGDMVMSTLYIDRKDVHVKLDGNALAFYAGGERQGIEGHNTVYGE